MPIATRCIIAAIIVLGLLQGPRARADQAAEQAAAELLEMRMRNQRPEDYRILKATEGKKVVVVRGDMDHIEDVLRAARIPHRVITPRQVWKYDLTADHILMINCPGEIGPKGIRRIKQFVTAGGLLYTTDWALANVIQKAFPGTVKYNGRGTGDHVTQVHVHAHDDNMMSQMLLRTGSTPQWWLEGGSFPIQILDPKRVQVLASSRQMKKSYGAAPVVVRFRWEDGEVIHVVSHFYRQAKTQGPSVAAAKAIDQVDGLSTEQKAAFGRGAGGAVNMSEVESSYAFQQMTGNMVVEKQKRNRKLDQSYGYETAAPVPIGDAMAPARRRVKVLQRKQDQVKVRDDRGNEGWVDEDALELR